MIGMAGGLLRAPPASSWTLRVGSQAHLVAALLHLHLGLDLLLVLRLPRRVLIHLLFFAFALDLVIGGEHHKFGLGQLTTEFTYRFAQFGS